MQYQLGYSIIEEFNNNDKNEKTNVNSIESKKKTRKNRNTSVNKKVESFLASIDNDTDNEAFTKFESDYDNHINKFNNNPYVNPVSVYNEKQNELEKQETIQSNEDNVVSNEQFQTFQNQSQQEYFNSYIPYSTNASNTPQSFDNQGMLIEKLNYMIHLLEEQQEEKTGHVTEELILYSFLGVFVIFVIDSFARASKYVR
jgi:hypothetical protein